MTEIALETGAEDVEYDAEATTIYALAADFLGVKQALEKQDLTILSGEMGYVPKSYIQVEDKNVARKVLKLVEWLEENDDVQSVWSNYEMDPAWLEELSS